MHEKITEANLSPEVFVKSFKNLVKIIEVEDAPALTIEVKYEGEKYTAALDFSAVKIDSYEVTDQVWEYIRQCDISTELIYTLANVAQDFLEKNNTYMYRIPVPLGLKPLKTGVTFALDLRVFRNDEGEEGEENATV